MSSLKNDTLRETSHRARRAGATGARGAIAARHRVPRQFVKLRRLALPLLMLVAWQAVAESGLFKPVFMPPLQTIVQRLFELSGNGVLIGAVGASLGRLFAGFAVAVVLGIAMGLFVTRLGFAEQMAVRLLSALLATPAVAWTPLFMLWFGLGNPATIALVVFVGAMPIALNTWSGIRTIDKVYIRVADSVNIRGMRRFYKVILPAAFAPVLSGVRLGFARSWHGLVAGELLAGAASGLGVLVTKGLVFLDTPSMIVGVLAIAFFAYLTERLFFERIDRLMLQRWGLLQSR
jgi:ABC-type nitrate/sulfonate/bicarbonate transport system permease component